jgi:hypothetical protein
MPEALWLSSTTGLQALANKETPIAPDVVRLKAREQFTPPAEAHYGNPLRRSDELIWGFP